MLFLLLLVRSILADITCSFNEGSCGWKLEPPWNRVTVANVPGAMATVEQIQSDGPFLLAQGQFGSIADGNITVNLEPIQRRGVLSFRYVKLGNAKMKILMKNETSEILIDKLEDSSQAEWTRRNVVLDVVGTSSSLVFVTSNIATSHDVIGVDDVLLQYQPSVLWAGKDSVFFDRNDLERRETRRSPNKPNEKSCESIKCNFKSTACSWSSANFHLLTSKIVSEGSGESLLVSEPTLFPMNGHLQMDLYTSDSSTTSVLVRSGSEESLLWKQSNLLEEGWNHVRFPIKYSPLPATIVIKSFCPPGGYVAISNTDLVDESGRPLTCGSNTLPIRPKHDHVIRLTAIQKLDGSENSVNYQPPYIGPPQVPPRPSIFKSIDKAAESKPAFASLPISPVQVSSRNSFLPFLPGLLPTTTPKPVLHGIRHQKLITVAPQVAVTVASTKVTKPVEDSDLLKSLAKGTGGLAERINSLMKPPAAFGDDSKPFTRKNIDEIVENAFRRFGQEQ